ncbi:hypothetical protein E0W80_18680 [Microbacterium sp. PI-1]|uniref:hypothetical protein n=1 Tax=Microbacterium sp. PI-1 TaxID=2545631 RepID=UPI00103EA9B5|nr:hypothetical protein [Microbacterium sp. PI-1]TCJ20833.1 hypothetical protein E0W80_18680 [Microbacterium sp. PI-1]
MLSLFDDDPSTEDAPTAPVMMSDLQRSEIRSLFESLEVRTAREQFELVAEVTGTRITSVGQLDGATAHRLIARLQSRIANQARVSTGSSWDDRTEDTWIDRL